MKLSAIKIQNHGRAQDRDVHARGQVVVEMG